MKRITWLSHQDAPEWFPPAERALDEPAGLLAAGGDLSPAFQDEPDAANQSQQRRGRFWDLDARPAALIATEGLTAG